MEAEAAEAAVVMAVFKIHTDIPGSSESSVFFLLRKLFYYLANRRVRLYKENNQGRSRLFPPILVSNSIHCGGKGIYFFVKGRRETGVSLENKRDLVEFYGRSGVGVVVVGLSGN